MNNANMIATTSATTPARGASTQLLPHRYFARKHARRVFCIWLFVVFSLLSTMLGVLAPVWIRGQRTRGKNSQLVAQSRPLADLVLKTQQLTLKNQRLSQWNQWVESAKPDDSLLQTIAAAAQATNPAASGIEIESLEIQLPLEYPANGQQVPKWATPHFLITAKVQDGISARSWIERIGSNERIEDARSRLMPGTLMGGTVQVTAKPVATCVLP